MANSNYRIEIQPVEGEVRAVNGDGVLAASRRAKVMYETRLPPTIYFPYDDVIADLREAPQKRTFCPFKGTATYMDVLQGDRIVSAGAWLYKKALPEALEIENHIGFMPSAADPIDVSGLTPPPDLYANISGPLVDWVMREAWQCDSPQELTRALGHKFLEEGIAVSRLSVMIWSLHPLIAGKNHIWTREDGKVATFTPSYDIHANPAFVNSPLRLVSEGLGGVRQSLLAQEQEFSFPIMEDLKSKGATDYVAMPLPFSNGQFNVLTLTSDHPKGFTTANLGLIFECAFVISRYYEVFTLQENASALLETYLGKRTGARVLGGKIRRGDGDEIDAAILFCDLRNSSRLEETLGRTAYLDLLNRFFEATADTINAHDGEILKFIGDAVLAIFPAGGDKRKACRQAVAAAREIVDGIADENTDCAIGIAFGNVTYGNVGSLQRLDFTVIGAAANIAARLGELGKKIEHRIVATAEFSDPRSSGVTPLGEVTLHNVSEPVAAIAIGPLS